MKKVLFLIVFVFLVFKSAIAIACSVFNVTTDSTVLAGRNHDHYDESGTMKYLLEFSPASVGKNGAFFSVVEYMNNYSPAEGFNDKGLFMGAASVPRTTIINDNSKTGVYGDHIIRIILERCSNVDEAIIEMEKYYIQFEQISGYPAHYMITDPSGRSVIIEYVNKEMRVVEKKGNSQYMANAYLSEVKSDDTPSWSRDHRYNTLKSLLENNNKVSINDAFSILSKVAQGQYSTQTSTIYDLKKKVITLVWQRKYGRKISFNLDNELRKGTQIKEIIYLKFEEDKAVSELGLAETNDSLPLIANSVPCLYENGWPAFSINYPAGWIDKTPQPNTGIVLWAETSSRMPFIQVRVLPNINLPLEYSSRIYLKKLTDIGNNIKLIYEKGIKLKDNTRAQEAEFAFLSNTGEKINAYFLTAKKEDTWICVIISSDRGKITKEQKNFAYSLNIKPGEDKPVDLPDDIKKFVNKIESDVLSHDIDVIMHNISDKFLNYGISKSEFESALKMMIQSIASFRIIITKIEILENRVNVAGFMKVNNIHKSFYSDTYIKENDQWKCHGNQKPKLM